MTYSSWTAQTINPSVSVRVYSRRFWFLLGGSVLLLVVLFTLHVGIGRVQLTPTQVIAALQNQPEEPFHRQIVWELRLPRGLIAAVAGALLGLAGAILQTILRNPLASPELSGVTGGGVLLIALWLLLRPEALDTPPIFLPFLAVFGGLLAGWIVYALSWYGGTRPARLALVGILIGFILSTLVSMIVLIRPSSLGGILIWVIGSLNGRVWSHWEMLYPWALMTLPLGLMSAGLANVLHLGDEIAWGLGVHVERTRLLLFGMAALLTAGAVSVVGALGFVGLIAPHIARQIVGSDARRLFPISLLFGACLLLAADVAAQAITINPPFQAAPARAGLPVGAITAFIGAPFFIYLARRRR